MKKYFIIRVVETSNRGKTRLYEPSDSKLRIHFEEERNAISHIEIFGCLSYTYTILTTYHK